MFDLLYIITLLMHILSCTYRHFNRNICLYQSLKSTSLGAKVHAYNKYCFSDEENVITWLFMFLWRLAEGLHLHLQRAAGAFLPTHLKLKHLFTWISSLVINSQQIQLYCLYVTSQPRHLVKQRTHWEWKRETSSWFVPQSNCCTDSHGH